MTDPATDLPAEAAAGTGGPEAVPPPPAEADAAAAERPAGEDAEYEYVYEDEHGNPLEAPPDGFNPEEFEEHVVEDGPPAAEAPGPTEAAAAAGAPASAPATRRDTRRSRYGSTRPRNMPPAREARPGERALSSRRLTPEEAALRMKHARIKTILMLASIALIPILIIAIILTYCYKHGYWPFRRAPKVVTVQNDYNLGLDAASPALREFARARQLHGTSTISDDEYYAILEKCERDVNEGLRLMRAWRDANPGDYHQVDERIRDANVKLKEVREEKFKIEMRRGRQ